MRVWLFAICFLFSLKLFPQVSIVGSNVSPYYVTAESLVNLLIVNSGSECHGTLSVILYNDQSKEAVLKVVTDEFTIKPGNSSVNTSFARISSSSFSNGVVAEFVKISKSLPAGLYRVCASLTVRELESSEKFCEELQSDVQPFLELIFPFNKDTIESDYPMLIWNHSAQFLNSPNDYYRIIVTELRQDQSASAAVTINSPLFIKDYLDNHHIQYPLNATRLEDGKTYAWQVQRFVNGVITNKSDSWSFIIRKAISPLDSKFATLYPEENCGLHFINNNKLYFHFDEEYMGAKLDYKVLDAEKIELKAKRRAKGVAQADIDLVKKIGYNEYLINLNEYKSFKGIGFLVVKNEKGESFYLRFIQK